MITYYKYHFNLKFRKLRIGPKRFNVRRNFKSQNLSMCGGIVTCQCVAWRVFFSSSLAVACGKMNHHFGLVGRAIDRIKYAKHTRCSWSVWRCWWHGKMRGRKSHFIAVVKSPTIIVNEIRCDQLQNKAHQFCRMAHKWPTLPLLLLLFFHFFFLLRLWTWKGKIYTWQMNE